MIHGTADARLEPLRDVLAGLVESGQDTGVSAAVVHRGEPIADLWGGWADAERTRAWDADTVTNLWSLTKTVTALGVLILVDRGVVDPYSPVARYWPEFAARGKEGVEVRHLLSHTSGVSGWEQPVTLEDVYDLDRSVSRLAGQQPWWEPGTASGYHAVTYGHLIGELVRRTSGVSLRDFVAKEIAGPLGADFHIGMPEAEWDRVADNITFPPPPPPPGDLDMESVMMKTATGPFPPVEAASTAAWRRADMGGVNGHGNARSIARIQSVVTNGGAVDGVRLLSPATIERIFEPQVEGPDLVIGSHLRWGLGYCLEYGETPYVPTGRVCFWGGRGGSMVVNDVGRGLTVAFVMNRLAADAIGSPSARAVIDTVYESLT